MAAPLSADRIVAALRAEGLRVVEYRSWRTHNRNHKGPWGPVHGVMVHHTVTSGTQNTVELCYNGHSTLPGPLCLGVIAKDGTVYLVGYGRANHAGSGDDDVLRAVIAERALPAPNENNTDGNARFYGFEAVNLGDGKDPWPEAQLDAIERASAAICRAHGWNERSVIGHLEWTATKIDPRGFSMDTMRSRIGARLDGTPTPTPTTPPEDGMELKDKVDLTYAKDGERVLLWAGRLIDGKSEISVNYALACAAASLFNQRETVLPAIKALTAKVDALGSVELTDAQVAALADKVAAHPSLAEQIAERVAEKLAERLAN